MGGSRRGYITFLLLVQWAYLILIPYSVPTTPHSLLPAYAAERALFEQTAFKRALRQSASDAFHDLKTDSSVAELAAEAIGIPSQAYDEMTLEEQEQAAREMVVSRWASLSKDWSTQSGFDASVSCPPLPDCSQSLHLSDDSQNLTLDGNIEAALVHRSLDLRISSTLPPGNVDS